MATPSVAVLSVTYMSSVIQSDNCTAHGDPEPCSTTAEFIIYMYVFSIVSYTGIILNVLNLVVFTRPGYRMNKTTLTFLTALAAFDLGYLFTAAGIAVIRCVPPKQSWEVYFRSYFEVYVYLPICNSLASASVFLTVVISAERFLSIRQVTWVKPRRDRWKVVGTVVTCLVAGLAMNAPYFFYKEVDDNGETTYTEYGQSEGFAHYSWARLILNKILPIVIIIVFNSLLVSAVVRSRRQAKSTSDVVPSNVSVRRRRQQTRLTVMMISISFMLAVCHSFEPFAHGGLYKTIFGPCSTHTTEYQLVRVVANTLEALSFASNFVFYCLFNGEFLKTLRVALCCCLYRRTVPGCPDCDPGETSVNVIANAQTMEGSEKA